MFGLAAWLRKEYQELYNKHISVIGQAPAPEPIPRPRRTGFEFLDTKTSISRHSGNNQLLLSEQLDEASSK